MVKKELINGKRFVWFVSNFWGNREDVIEGVERVGEGVIIINYI